MDREKLLIVRVEPRGSDQRNVPGASDRLDRTYRDLLQRVGSIPGVRAASLAHFSPTSPVALEGPPPAPGRHTAAGCANDGLPELFCNNGHSAACGARFAERDLDPGSPLVGVVNEAFVRQFMNGENPVGRRLLVERDERAREIIGVVEETPGYSSLREDTPPLMYQPFLQTSTGPWTDDAARPHLG